MKKVFLWMLRVFDKALFMLGLVRVYKAHMAANVSHKHFSILEANEAAKINGTRPNPKEVLRHLSGFSQTFRRLVWDDRVQIPSIPRAGKDVEGRICLGHDFQLYKCERVGNISNGRLRYVPFIPRKKSKIIT